MSVLVYSSVLLGRENTREPFTVRVSEGLFSVLSLFLSEFKKPSVDTHSHAREARTELGEQSTITIYLRTSFGVLSRKRTASTRRTDNE